MVVRRLGRGGPSDTARIALDGQDDEAGALEVRAMLDVTEAVRSPGSSSSRRDARDHPRAPRGAVLDAARRLPGHRAALQERAGDRRPAALGGREELAVSLQDVLLRRTASTGLSRLDCAPAIAQRMGAPSAGAAPRRGGARRLRGHRPPGPPLPEE